MLLNFGYIDTLTSVLETCYQISEKHELIMENILKYTEFIRLKIFFFYLFNEEAANWKEEKNRIGHVQCVQFNLWFSCDLL